MDEYVDVFSDKYTKMWKMIAWIRFVVKITICLILTIGIIIFTDVLAPFIKGEAEWEAAPFTLSQINALLCYFVIAFLSIKAIKGYSRW